MALRFQSESMEALTIFPSRGDRRLGSRERLPLGLGCRSINPVPLKEQAADARKIGTGESDDKILQDRKAHKRNSSR